MRRLHGPEDGYRSKRESSGDPGVHGALGFPEDENLRGGERDDAASTKKGGTNEDDDFVRVGALAKSHARSVGTAARTSEVRDMRAAFALMSNARSPLHAARMSDKMLNGVGRRSNDDFNDDPFSAVARESEIFRLLRSRFSREKRVFRERRGRRRSVRAVAAAATRYIRRDANRGALRNVSGRRKGGRQGGQRKR